MKIEEKQFYAERLETLWAKYIVFVNFVVTLTGGTVLVLLVKVVELKIEKHAIPEVSKLTITALIVSA